MRAEVKSDWSSLWRSLQLPDREVALILEWEIRVADGPLPHHEGEGGRGKVGFQGYRRILGDSQVPKIYG